MPPKWQRMGATAPNYYRAGLYRPCDRPSQPYTPEKLAWDMVDHWMTAGEWLAWIKRKEKKKLWWDGKRWRYPSRPIITAHYHRVWWSTSKRSPLP